ncbi:MAG TPA: hypothetical protein VGS05_05925 [Candidatus Sulfotelmatobacter sp.]|nr:hypothetical protein [Candidatus Sulfotelmatobacter sp.]
MSKRAWVVFGSVQIIGCILATYGTVYSESTFVRGSWLFGFLLLLPGNLPAMALDQKMMHVRTAYVFLPVAVACNALLWMICAEVWRMVRRRAQSTFDKYRLALAATCLSFVVANTVHLLRRVTCYDCFFPYGVPFTFYRDGGYAGGGGLELRGLFADGLTVIICGVLIGGIWQRLAAKRS